MRTVREPKLYLRRSVFEEGRRVLLRSHVSVWGCVQVSSELRLPSGPQAVRAFRRTGADDVECRR